MNRFVSIRIDFTRWTRTGGSKFLPSFQPTEFQHYSPIFHFFFAQRAAQIFPAVRTCIFYLPLRQCAILRVRTRSSFSAHSLPGLWHERLYFLLRISSFVSCLNLNYRCNPFHLPLLRGLSLLAYHCQRIPAVPHLFRALSSDSVFPIRPAFGIQRMLSVSIARDFRHQPFMPP